MICPRVKTGGKVVILRYFPTICNYICICQKKVVPLQPEFSWFHFGTYSSPRKNCDS